MRSFALYKPFRFFFGIGVLPVRAVARCWWPGGPTCSMFTDDVASRVPSLVAAAVLLLLSVQVWVFGLLADLLSANRRVLAEVRRSQRREELDRARADRRHPG